MIIINDIKLLASSSSSLSLEEEEEEEERKKKSKSIAWMGTVEHRLHGARASRILLQL